MLIYRFISVFSLFNHVRCKAPLADLGGAKPRHIRIDLFYNALRIPYNYKPFWVKYNEFVIFIIEH